jgi:hypothetical protein
MNNDNSSGTVLLNSIEHKIKHNTLHETTNYDFKTVCLKERVFLKREKSCNIFSLQLNVESINKNLHDIVNLNMYNLIFKLNTDNFEKIEVKKWISPTEVEILFLFKPFGKELGIKPKYMYIKTIQQITNEKHVYTSFDIDYPNLEELRNYEKVRNTISTMVVNFESDFRINISYIFKFELVNSLPIYMENILGLIMKKMFLNLKNFIEMV